MLHHYFSWLFQVATTDYTWRQFSCDVTSCLIYGFTEERRKSPSCSGFFIFLPRDKSQSTADIFDFSVVGSLNTIAQIWIKEEEGSYWGRLSCSWQDAIKTMCWIEDIVKKKGNACIQCLRKLWMNWYVFGSHGMARNNLRLKLFNLIVIADCTVCICIYAAEPWFHFACVW